ASDSTVRFNAALIMLQAGSKIAQVGAYDRAYPWLDQLLQVVAPRTPADTVGPRKQVRVQASFWYGLASTYSLPGPYSDMVTSERGADPRWAAGSSPVSPAGTRLAGRRIRPRLPRQAGLSFCPGVRGGGGGGGERRRLAIMCRSSLAPSGPGRRGAAGPWMPP